ncbi:MAG: hypothetical protein KTR15_10190 [Phycisphaeraceae bacterium]|nr:hypothetical protein [Phycisphaeraceae bacterium]
MKLITHTIALACIACLLTACSESTSDEVLPEGAAPNDPPADREVDPSPQPEPEVQAPEPQPEPEATTLPPLPLPLPEGDAERSIAPGITYVLPEGWTVGPARQMRLLTLIPPDADGADLAISKWPGDVGGFASNVQRWVRQAGLPPIPGLMTAAASDFEKFIVGDTTATWIPLMNEGTNVAILAVWVPRGESPENPTETWTFKLTCKADQVQQIAPAVRAFCESVKFEN